MIRFFLFLLFFSHEVIASVTGKTLICDNNTRGYHFISEKKVNVLSINLDELTIITIEHFYELTENAIFLEIISFILLFLITYIIFSIIAPENSESEHLLILSSISKFLKKKDALTKLRELNNEAKIYEFLSKF